MPWELTIIQFRPLNRSYLLYRGLVTHANDVLSKLHVATHMNGFCCVRKKRELLHDLYSDYLKQDQTKGRIIVSLDGNFQLKRRAGKQSVATSRPAPVSVPASASASTSAFIPASQNLFQPSKLESSLWGGKEEVEKYEYPDKTGKDNACTVNSV